MNDDDIADHRAMDRSDRKILALWREDVERYMNEIKVMKQLKAFIRSVTSVEAFAHKVKLLTESDPKKLQMLFAHSRKGTQYKTDQNFYFLCCINWILILLITIVTKRSLQFLKCMN